MKRRSVLTMLLALVLAFVLMPMNAEAATGGSCGDGVSWSFDEATGTLTISGEGAMDDYSWLDQPWADISDGVTTVVIEEGVTHVGDNAFYCCDNADTAIIASTVTEVGTYAFYGHFEEFYFKGNVPQTGNLAFFSKVGATAYYPQGDATWTEDARDGIDNYLQWKTWQPGTDPDPVPSGPDNTCGDDLRWVLATDGTLTIYGTGEMTDFPDRSDSPWYRQREAVTSIVIEEGVTHIGSNAFELCKNMTEAVIPSSVVSIGSNAFSLTGLADVTLEEGLQSIGDSAFRFCDFTEIDIPDSVTYIGQRAFEQCENLTSAVLPQGLTTINHYTFSGCAKLVSIDIPESVYSIGFGAFEECTALSKLDLPTGLTSIGEQAFSKCSGLTGTVIVPESVTTLADWTFYRCSGLTEVILPEGLTSIGGQAFRGCTALSKLAIPDSVKSIGSEAFLDCISLTAIEIPEGITNIERNTFNNCAALAEVTIPESVASISDFAFSYCYGLENITIPANVASIGQFAFFRCTAVTSIEFKGDAPQIGYNAFGQVTANAFYPADNATWTEEILQSYRETVGDKVTWHGEGSHDHSYTKEEVTLPTCTEQGYTTCTCSCGDSYVDNYVAEAGHKPGDQWLTDSENHWHVCTVCEEILDAQAHSAGERCEVCEMEFVIEPEHLYSLGDSSHDGNINAKDATLVLRYSVGSLSENMVFCELCADYTGDGNINAKDATKILRASVGLP